MEKIAVIPSRFIKSTESVNTDVSSFFSLEKEIFFDDRSKTEISSINNPCRQLVTQVMVFVIPSFIYNIEEEKMMKQEIVNHAKLVCTKRLQGESRLKGMYAAALGGHVEEKDFQEYGQPLSLEDALKKSAIRELTEELYAAKYQGVWMKTIEKSLIPIGIICTDDSEVEKAHSSILYILAVSDICDIKILEDHKLSELHVSLLDFPKFLTKNNDEIDNWSSIMLSLPVNLITNSICDSILSL